MRPLNSSFRDVTKKQECGKGKIGFGLGATRASHKGEGDDVIESFNLRVSDLLVKGNCD